MIHALFWDLDDTILDFAAAESSAIKHTFIELGIGICTDEMLHRYTQINAFYWQKLERGEMDKETILVERYRAFFREIGVDENLAVHFNDVYEAHLPDNTVFCPHALEVLQAFQGRIPQYVVTNGSAPVQRSRLSVSGLDRIFSGVFISEEVGAAKPSTAYFDRVLTAIGSPERSELLMIGDSLTSDMKGGADAGMCTCWYNPKAITAPPNAPRIDHVIHDLREVLAIADIG